MPIYLDDDDLGPTTMRVTRSWWELIRMARRHNRRVATATRRPARAGDDARVTITVVLTSRQAAALGALAEDGELSLNAVGQAAVVAFLETHGYHEDGPRPR